MEQQAASPTFVTRTVPSAWPDRLHAAPHPAGGHMPLPSSPLPCCSGRTAPPAPPAPISCTSTFSTPFHRHLLPLGMTLPCKNLPPPHPRPGHATGKHPHTKPRASSPGAEHHPACTSQGRAGAPCCAPTQRPHGTLAHTGASLCQPHRSQRASASFAFHVVTALNAAESPRGLLLCKGEAEAQKIPQTAQGYQLLKHVESILSQKSLSRPQTDVPP